jgi:hypothetical protein
MHVTFATPFKVLASVSRDRVFWILFGTFFICGLSTNGLIQTHFISLCGDAGLGAVPAASVLAMMGAFDLVGTIASGWLSDRYDNRKLLFCTTAARLSLFWLPYSEFTLVWPVAVRHVLWPGLDRDGAADGAPGRRHLRQGARRHGVRLDLRRPPAGRGVAAYGAGRVRTLLLTYNPALFAAGAACLVAAAIILMIRKPAAVVAVTPAVPPPRPRNWKRCQNVIRLSSAGATMRRSLTA